MRTHVAAALGGAAIVLAGCGGSSTPGVDDARGTESQRAAGPLTYDCAGTVSGTADELTDGPGPSEFRDHPGYEFFAGWARGELDRWVVVDASDDRLVGIRELDEPEESPDGQRLTHERLEIAPVTETAEGDEELLGEWSLRDAGRCSLQAVLAGLNAAHLVVDGESPPTPDSSEIALLVTETARTCGATAEGRIEVVDVETTDGEVRVVLGVEPQEGAGPCQSHPPTPFTLRLDEPLGDRAVVDAAVLPPKVIWSPSDSAEESASPTPSRSSTGTATDVDRPAADVPTLEEPECDDGGSCAAGFLIADTFYALSCGAVRPDAVTEDTLARGVLSGEEVEVRRVDGASTDVLVAVSVEGGLCGDDDVALSPWSMAFPAGASQSELEATICLVVVDEHRARNDCG